MDVLGSLVYNDVLILGILSHWLAISLITFESGCDRGIQIKLARIAVLRSTSKIY